MNYQDLRHDRWLTERLEDEIKGTSGNRYEYELEQKERNRVGERVVP